MDTFIMILCLYVLPTLFIILYAKYFNKEDEVSTVATIFMLLPIINLSWLFIILLHCIGRFAENNWLTNWINEGKEFDDD